MLDEHFIKIKNRMLLRSKELWGIKDIRNVDPVLDLLLHTFSSEISKLHQQIHISDKEILDRLSRVLIGNRWTLPFPAHGLLTAKPKDDITELNISDHFYSVKKRFGEGNLDIFFTPIFNKRLINASVKFIGYDTQFYYENQFGEKELAFSLSEDKKIRDYECWFGIEISDDILEKINDLSLSFILKDSLLLPFIKTMNIFDISENKLTFKQEYFQQSNTETHYFDDVISFYEDSFYNLELTELSKVKKSANELFNVTKENFYIDTKSLDKGLLWFKIQLPEVFVKEKIAGIEIGLNTFPVVNRKLEYKHHNFKKNGRILSVLNNGNDYFLNIEELIDNKGNSYENVVNNTSEDLEGSYSLYFGDIGRFDTRSAKMLLSKTFQTVREEGSAFSAVGYDIIQGYLDDLHKKLDEISKKLNTEYGNVNINNNKTFLLTYPHKNSFNYEFKYWLTNADVANGIDKTNIVSQYKTGKFIDESIRLKTETIGGYTRKSEHDKINNLRYGLLTRERIVTREDVKSFIKSKIDAFVDDITIKDGVTIAKEKKKGLARTTEISIKMNSEHVLSIEKQNVFSHYLEKELEKKSISNIIYKVLFV